MMALGPCLDRIKEMEREEEVVVGEIHFPISLQASS